MRMVLVAIMAYMLSGTAFADHVPFLDGKTRHTGGSCCGHGNCVPMPVAYGRHGDEVIVKGIHITLDPGSIHPTADPTGRGWYCFSMATECVGKDGVPVVSSKCAMCAFPERPEGES